jgi:uncharacterized protein YjiS (DUF1127 family)
MNNNYASAHAVPRAFEITRALFDAVFAISKAIKRFDDEMQQRRRIRTGTEQLMSMPDYMLRDMGISRSEIRFVTRHGRQADRVSN